MPLKRYYPDFQAHVGNQVTPDEMDRYEVYQVINPAISATFFGSATAGTVSQVAAVGLGNTRADYPRNLAAIFTGSASVSGTVHAVGKNQFGVSITEDIGLAQGTQTAGTAAGTKVFAQVSAATITFGTGVTGTGTVSLGVPIAAADAKFGLPVKLGGTADVKSITWTNETGVAIPLNGGTIGAYVGTANHEFRGTADLEGTTTYTAVVKSTWKAPGDNTAKIANL